MLSWTSSEFMKRLCNRDLCQPVYTTGQNPKAVLLKHGCAPESYGDHVGMPILIQGVWGTA